MIPDDLETIKKNFCQIADKDNIDLILTTGGTGFSHRDVTPEATLAVIDRRTPGIPEAMRYLSLQITPRAMLSRAEAGLRNNTLIVNMPGSPKAIKETLEYIMPSVAHGLDILQGNAADCARK
jgi:molybdenum cofactor synthesis domain-containing protein